MFEVLTVIAPLFIIIFTSAILQKFNALGENWDKVLNEFALKIGLPVLIFSSLANARLDFVAQTQLIVINSILILSTFIIAFIISKLFRFTAHISRTVFFCLGFGNIAYLGIPILVQINGVNILPVASLIVTIYLFWFFSIGVMVLDYNTTNNKKGILTKSLKHLITDPLIIAVILGIIISIGNIVLPDIIIKSLDMITASVTPTVLIVIGLFIGKSKFGKIQDWIPVLLFSICILILIPALFYLTLLISNIDPIQFTSSIIQAAMPLAITPFALADKYTLDKDFIAKSIVLSTILSVFSLPFWIYFLGI
jgi:predicted permease